VPLHIFFCPCCSFFLSCVSRHARHYLGLRFAKVRGINWVHEFFIADWLFWLLSIGRGHGKGIWVMAHICASFVLNRCGYKVGKLLMKSMSLTFDFIHQHTSMKSPRRVFVSSKTLIDIDNVTTITTNSK
jgi:hypothetical protein